jgi:isopenicillin-N N-acyltransferase-like protein
MPVQVNKISLSGSPEEIGYQHGETLAEQIHRNIEFYKSIFLNNLGNEAKVFKAVEHLKEQIEKYNPNYITEIDHIALGAGVTEPLWLYALNSRTELTLTKESNECTAIVFPQHHIIGQTWDWAQSIEDNFVIMEIQFPSGHKILQLTEAGIIGKIGLNSDGLGQTLNILWSIDSVLSGVPIHVILRAVLESHTLEEAKKAIERSGGGTASNIIVAQARGAFDAEFAGSGTFIHDIEGHTYVHTNHYLHCPQPIQIDETYTANSRTRHKTAVGKLSQVDEYSIPEMISILSDRSKGEDSILAKKKLGTLGELGYTGTLATIVMDLEKRTMMVRKGNPSSPSFAIDEFTEFWID